MKRNDFLKLLAFLPFTSMAAKTEVVKSGEKVIFTPEMLRKHNFGLFIINSRVKNVAERPGYAATVSWKLGYTNHLLKDNNLRYGKISFLTDGWFCPLTETAEQLCNWLNNNPHGETFRLMSREEVNYLINNRNQGFLL